MVTRYTVQTGETIPVWTGAGILDEIVQLVPDRAATLWVVDSRVWNLHESVLKGVAELCPRPAFHIVPAGEAAKCRSEKQRMESAAFAHGLGRDGVIVAVGGGVVGDLAGYVAATYMRGIDLVQVPTTVVSMVDSSVGGKTGIDVPEGKNLIGAFKHPIGIVSDLQFLSTLPPDIYRDGFAEVIKHGAIANAPMLIRIRGAMEQIRKRDLDWLVTLITANQQIKIDVVVADTQEGGLRQILNFGHTLGHALEREANYGLSHGLCVALGMILECHLGERLGATRAGTASELTDLLGSIGFPVTDLLYGFAPHQLLSATRHDKKVRNGRGNYVLLEELGKVAMTADGRYAFPVPDAEVLACLQSLSHR